MVLPLAPECAGWHDGATPDPLRKKNLPTTPKHIQIATTTILSASMASWCVVYLSFITVGNSTDRWARGAILFYLVLPSSGPSSGSRARASTSSFSFQKHHITASLIGRNFAQRTTYWTPNSQHRFWVGTPKLSSPHNDAELFSIVQRIQHHNFRLTNIAIKNGITAGATIS